MESRRLRFQLFRSASQKARNALLLLLWLQVMVAGLGAEAVAQSRPCAGYAKPAILYTGKTYGYLRANDPDPSAASAFDKAYDFISLALCPQAILVGMGDNLAPEYGSRLKIAPKIEESKFIERLEPPWSRIPLQWPPLPGLWPG